MLAKTDVILEVIQTDVIWRSFLIKVYLRILKTIVSQDDNFSKLSQAKVYKHISQSHKQFPFFRATFWYFFIYNIKLQIYGK